MDNQKNRARSLRVLRNSKEAYRIFAFLFSIPLISPLIVGPEKYVSSGLYQFHIIGIFITIGFTLYLYQKVLIYKDRIVVKRFRFLKVVAYTMKIDSIKSIENSNPIFITGKNGDVIHLRWTMLNQEDKKYLVNFINDITRNLKNKK